MSAPRSGVITPWITPKKGEQVEDPTLGTGIVTRGLKGATGAIFVRFPGSDAEVMYSLRTALGEWRRFPGPADAPGLRL